jgi:flagellar protein FliO/FliZ
MSSNSDSFASMLGTTVVSLLLVLALAWVMIWLLKRSQMAKGTQAGGLKIVNTVALGPRERLVQIQLGDKEMLLGVTANGIQVLSEASLPSPPPASSETAADSVQGRQ